MCSDEDIRVLCGSSGAAEASLLSMNCVKCEQRTCSGRYLPPSLQGSGMISLSLP